MNISTPRSQPRAMPEMVLLPVLRWLALSLPLALPLALGGCASIMGSTAAPLGEATPLKLLSTQSNLADSMVARPAASTATAPPAATPAEPAARGAEPGSEQRFDLIVNGAQAKDVFLALAADNRVNILTHPDLSGSISVTLRRVTLREALEAIRDVYGYDFKIEGRRIVIYPPTMQSRVFVVNYLHSQRNGRSEVRVSSGAAPVNGNTIGSTGAPGNGGNTAPGQNTTPAVESSQVSTTSRNDLWAELGDALRGMVGTAGGRSVILSPQSGMIAVRAMPEELRQVEALLNAARVAIERQVMLDVKIVSVELREGFQSGIDWSLLRGHANVGTLSGGTSNSLLANGSGLPTLPVPPGGGLLSDNVPLPVPGSGLFGLSLAARGFQSVLGFLETHGEVQTLSSPRLATMNNQKAVLKVGTDDYFVTNVSGGTVATGSGTTNASTTMPTLTLTPFFSGIALDVTPQIDEGNMITLHVHPSVSAVTEHNKQVDLGALGIYKLPLASSGINETDTMVRIPDGQIVAIGGLMQMESSRAESGLPGSHGSAFTATLMGNRANAARKKELIVLIKPTIIRSAEDWQQQTRQAWDDLNNPAAPLRTIRLDGPGQTGAPASAQPLVPPSAPNAAPHAAVAAPPALANTHETRAVALRAAADDTLDEAPAQPVAKLKRKPKRVKPAPETEPGSPALTRPIARPVRWVAPTLPVPAMRLRLADWPV